MNGNGITLANIWKKVGSTLTFKFAKFDFSLLTALRTYTFPNKSGTVAMLSDISGGGVDKSFVIAMSIAL